LSQIVQIVRHIETQVYFLMILPASVENIRNFANKTEVIMLKA